MKQIVCLSLLLLTIIGCQSQRRSAKAADPNLLSSQVQIAKTIETPSDEQLRFDMKKGSIVGDTLVLKVKYGGGCGKHTFALTADQKKEEVHQLWLIHEAEDDPCKAFVIKELKFDLSPLKSKNTSPLIFRVNHETGEYTYTW